MKGRSKNRRDRFKKIVKEHRNSLVFKNRKQLFKYYNDNNIKYTQ